MVRVSQSLATTIPISLVLLKIVAAYSPRTRFYVNVSLYVLSLGFCSLWGVVLSIVMSIIPGQRYNINRIVARSFYRIVSVLMNSQVKVEGAENLEKTPAVILGNHQSLMDIFYLGAVLPRNGVIMAKKELKLAPILGQFSMWCARALILTPVWLSGAVFIDRNSRKSAIETMADVGKQLREKHVSLWMFPEGTRSGLAEPGLLPFKKGAFHLAIQSQLPIIPIVCQNYHNLCDMKTRFDGGVIKVAGTCGMLRPLTCSPPSHQHQGLRHARHRRRYRARAHCHARQAQVYGQDGSGAGVQGFERTDAPSAHLIIGAAYSIFRSGSMAGKHGHSVEYAHVEAVSARRLPCQLPLTKHWRLWVAAIDVGCTTAHTTSVRGVSPQGAHEVQGAC